MKAASIPDPLSIDIDFRPASYFWPLSPEKHVLSRVQGSRRRQLLAAAAKKGQRVADELVRPRLSDFTRSELVSIDPSCMGGEFLAHAEDAEIEIARIEIKSTTYDVTSLYARPGNNRIHYRVVDEYEGDTLSARRKRTSIKPLSLRAMTDFFLQAWNLIGVLAMNFGDQGENVAEMLGFFNGSSPHYAEFDAYLRQRVLKTFCGDRR